MQASIAITTAPVQRRPQDGEHEDNVLQFLLGAAPLSNKTTPRGASDTMKAAAQGIERSVVADPVSKPPSLETSLAFQPGGDTANSNLLDVPVLEYGSDCDSEDDYIALEPVAVFQDGDSEEKQMVDSSAESGVMESDENQEASCSEDCEHGAQGLDVLPALGDEPEAQSETAVKDNLALGNLTIGGDGGSHAVKAANYTSDTASNCTDTDARSSDGEGAGELLEVEEEPLEQPEAVVGDKAKGESGDVKALLPSGPTISSPVSTPRDKSSPPSKRPISAQSDHLTADKSEEPHNLINKFDTQNDEKRENEQVTEQEHEKTRGSKETRRDSDRVSTTEDEDSDASLHSLSGDNFSRESLDKSLSSPLESPTPSEIALVGLVAIGILFYAVATIYAYFHPIFLPLPPLASFQTPMDLTNVSVVVASPANHSIAQQSLYFEWHLTDYPVEAISMYGPEVFQYRAFVNNKLVISEMGLLNTSSSVIGGSERGQLASKLSFNTTIKHRIPPHYLPDYGWYELLLQVALPIPGSEVDAVHSIEERVFVTKAFRVGKKLELIAPLDGTIFQSGESIVVEYRAVNVKRLDVVIDGNWIIRKQQVDDGTLLLQGLSTGRHTIALVGFDANGKEILGTGESKLTTAIEILS